MPAFRRDDPTEVAVVDQFEDGIGWIAHPAETGRRASHALRGDDGVWLLDPLDGPGVDDLVARVGEIAGVAVCSSWHARDAGRIADRYDVAVHAPEWLGRIDTLIDRAPIERYRFSPGDSGFRVLRCQPFPTWDEAMVYRPAGGILYVPESLGTADAYLVGDERVGLSIVRRIDPPIAQLDGLSVGRLLVGHGRGIHERPDEALEAALRYGRRRLPEALYRNGTDAFRSLLSAIRY